MPFIIYSALRLALILVAGVVLYLVGMRGWLLGVAAVLVALLVSYIALSRPREAAALYIATRRTERQTSGARRTTSLDRDNDAEDDAIDAGAPSPDGGVAAGPVSADDASPGSERETETEK